MCRFGLILFILFFLNACQSIGPAELKANRKVYNEVARESELEQLLQNIVRVRYSESSYFLKLTSLTTSFSFSSSLSASPSLSYNTNSPGSFSSVSRSLSASPSLSYSDSPTLSFIPIESAEFANQVQAPLTLTQLLTPYSGNYGEIPDFIFLSRLVFNTMGDHSNAGSLVESKVIELPRYKNFYEILHLILNLRLNGSINIHENDLKDLAMVHIEFYSRRDSLSPDALKLKKLLRVPKNADGFYLAESFDPCANPEGEDLLTPNSKPHYRSECPLSRTIYVEMRSILQIARFLSYAVQIPASDYEKGYVFELKNPDGTPYDLKELFNNLFTVYSSDEEPEDTYVKVYLHHHWFYIKNSDIHSKITFTFLQRLMTLIAGSQGTPAQSAPILTIPVGA